MDKNIMRKNNTKYISIEGADGSGKTTLIKNLHQYLVGLGKKVLLTKEIGSEHNKFCKQLREFALSDEYEQDEIAGQLLFAAIIRQHHQKVIKPALMDGEFDYILSDRGVDSNYAYGLAAGIPLNKLKKIYELVYGDSVLPDLTLYLNIDPKVSKKRIDSRKKESFTGGTVDRIEKKGFDFQEEVIKNFIKIAKKEKNRVKVIEINENVSTDDVLITSLSILKKRKFI